MIDHVCAHMQKMSNKKDITYTIHDVIMQLVVF